jgi:hypothetical protein
MKGLMIAVAIVSAAVAVDELYDYGTYTDAALAMFRDIRRSFGF